MDTSKKSELDRLLGQVQAEASTEKQRERELRIQQIRALRRFEELKRTDIRPALREIMARLERGGHHSQLEEPAANRIRLDFQLQSARRTAGQIELELPSDSEGPVRLRCQRNLHLVIDEPVELDRLSSNVVADVLLQFLRETLGKGAREP